MGRPTSHFIRRGSNWQRGRRMRLSLCLSRCQLEGVHLVAEDQWPDTGCRAHVHAAVRTLLLATALCLHIVDDESTLTARRDGEHEVDRRRACRLAAVSRLQLFPPAFRSSENQPLVWTHRRLCRHPMRARDRSVRWCPLHVPQARPESPSRPDVRRARTT